MFCKNCGKQISDVAAFCPYCGAKREESRQEAIEQPVVNEASVSVNSENGDAVPVYKRRNKAALLVGFIPLIYLIVTEFIYMVLMQMNVR